jgi:hypothetical protein
MQVEQDLEDSRQRLIALEAAGVDGGLEVAVDSLGNALAAVEYVTEVGRDVGGADRITEVLTTIRQSKVTLVKYSGG